jgi:hypothetical protein
VTPDGRDEVLEDQSSESSPDLVDDMRRVCERFGADFFDTPPPKYWWSWPTTSKPERSR